MSIVYYKFQIRIDFMNIFKLQLLISLS